MLTEAVFSKQALVVKLNAELDRRSAALTKCGEEITTLRRKEGALRKELEQSNAEIKREEESAAAVESSLESDPLFLEIRAGAHGSDANALLGMVKDASVR